MDSIEFGRTGLRVSRLAVGTGTHGFGGRSQQTALGVDGLANLLRRAYDLGVTFWDAADGYGSHPHVARALETVPRERVVIATKTMSRKADQMTRDIERFRRELNIDVLDIVLMHFLSHADWPTRYAGAAEALLRAQAAGKVRAVGISCHDLGVLRTAVEAPWIDVVLVRINYDGVNMDAKPARVVPVIEQLYVAGKAVYGMKVLGCGSLAHDPRKAIEYVLGLGTVHALAIGTSSLAQLEQNVRLIEDLSPRYPLR
ncbi:MAG: aldo/keto reductase [Anaerolineae bacterium]|nr:aldo/keto reductase [Anaerolineae bacterium]